MQSQNNDDELAVPVGNIQRSAAGSISQQLIKQHWAQQKQNTLLTSCDDADFTCFISFG